MELITTKRLKLTPDEYNMIEGTATLLRQICIELRGDILPLMDGEETTSSELEDMINTLDGLIVSSIL